MCSLKTETLLRYFHQEIRALADSYNVKFIMSNKVGALADRFRIGCCSAPKPPPLPPRALQVDVQGPLQHPVFALACEWRHSGVVCTRS